MDRINIIVAVTRENAIGRGGDQLAYISEDLRRFKALTEGHTVIMGRKTNLALPKRKLAKRRNIVVTRQDGFEVPEGVEIAHSPAEALRMSVGDGEIFVIGGGEIYRVMMREASRLYVTHIEMSVEGADTYFPEIGPEWEKTWESEQREDEKSGLGYRFAEYERREEAEEK